MYILTEFEIELYPPLSSVEFVTVGNYFEIYCSSTVASISQALASLAQALRAVDWIFRDA